MKKQHLEDCPFCGAKHTPDGHGVSYADDYGYFAEEDTGNVTCDCLPLGTVIPAEDWQNRPIEDGLRAENTALKQRIADLKELVRRLDHGEMI